ncbi:MAG TPA: hypothetical protein VH482_24350, partial [Thermomicrobiales bacterium]
MLGANQRRVNPKQVARIDDEEVLRFAQDLSPFAQATLDSGFDLQDMTFDGRSHTIAGCKADEPPLTLRN